MIPDHPSGGVQDYVYVISMTSFSICGFFVLRYFLDKLFRWEHWTITDDFKPGTCMYTEAKWQRLLNISSSLVHSAIAGVSAFIAFILYPEMCDDMITSYNDFTRNLMLFSLGYFYYDSIDNLSRSRATTNYYIIVHHVVCILAFTIGTIPGLFLGYGAVSLLMELSSVFLHLRVLLKMHGCDQQGLLYRVVSLVNIGAFLIFRVLVLGWMTRWLLNHRTQIPIFYSTFGTVGLVIMTVVNVVIFYQLLTADKYLNRKGL